MHQTAENEYGSDDADWNMPGNDLLPEHVSQTEQEGECTNLTGSTGTEGIASGTEEQLNASGNWLRTEASPVLIAVFMIASGVAPVVASV